MYVRHLIHGQSSANVAGGREDEKVVKAGHEAL
jgi:hypothetical protein